MNQQHTLDMILTSIVNNDSIRESIVNDIKDRFHVELNSNKLQNFLSSVNVTTDNSILLG